MNLLNSYLKEIIKQVKNNKEINSLLSEKNFSNINIDIPPENINFDLSSNIALVLGKRNKINPKEVALIIQKILSTKIKDFSLVDVAGPGFINIKLSNNSWVKNINTIFKNKKNFGNNKNKKKYNIEFVSANPTGPLHVGHCRGAIFGDVISNLLSFNGNKVTKEFYVNDYGNQINIFAKSVFYRLKEIKENLKFPDDKNLYPGQYIVDIARNILKKNPKLKLINFDNIKKKLIKESISESMSLIKKDLKNLGIKHDYFFYESQIVKKNLIKKSLEKLKKKQLVVEGFLKPPKGEDNSNWKKTKKLIFKSTLFGDDSDRSLQKDDGSWTYFANDLAYHSSKISRKYDYLINILGADHTGYVKRITAAVKAISNEKIFLQCKVCQLVKLYKNGEPFKMSKRLGEFISVNELLSEVNRDSIRFMMLNRGNEVEIDFDFNKVLEKNKDNPVFYIQYCYARINSLFRSIDLNLKKEIKLNTKQFQLNEYEYRILRKIIEWPKVVDSASIKLEPHRLTFYLYDLATIFHSYWTEGNKKEEFKFIINGKINKIISFKIFQLISIILENGMSVLGVSLPKKM
ncbi:MAG: arginine--tRNA ligase [Candidatus Marinimicrobia bacterium]|nr:arginine--tRNA ligase [Candidatus Neomarinimicrobiota bacterium]|tara:strand:- start:11591 stop:13315 length:1725 start_codon:yes stop_codon:yes gene_type:complete